MPARKFLWITKHGTDLNLEFSGVIEVAAAVRELFSANGSHNGRTIDRYEVTVIISSSTTLSMIIFW